MSKKCYWCDGTGKIEVPKDQKAFDEEFDRLDRVGAFNANDCRRMALEESGYTEEVCSHCNGTGIKPE